MHYYGTMRQNLIKEVDPIIDKMGDHFGTVFSDYTEDELKDAGLNPLEIVIFRLRCLDVAFEDCDCSIIFKRHREFIKSFRTLKKYGVDPDSIPQYILYMEDVLSSYISGMSRILLQRRK